MALLLAVTGEEPSGGSGELHPFPSAPFCGFLLYLSPSKRCLEIEDLSPGCCLPSPFILRCTEFLLAPVKSKQNFDLNYRN